MFLPGNTEVARRLLESGSDVYARDKFNLTPLMIAAAKDNLVLAQELEQKGAKYNVRVTYSKTSV